MTNFISTYSMDFNSMTFKNGDFVDSNLWPNLIKEHEGIFSSEDEFMTFEYLGIELIVSFNLSVTGVTSYDPGDYWTPPYSEFEMDDADIEIKGITIDEYDVELNNEIIEQVKVIINKIYGI